MPFHVIYPNEFQLKCEHHGSHAIFLALDITVVDGIQQYNIYHMRDNYPYFIVRMSDLRGIILAFVTQGLILSEFF